MLVLARAGGALRQPRGVELAGEVGGEPVLADLRGIVCVGAVAFAARDEVGRGGAGHERRLVAQQLDVERQGASGVEAVTSSP